MKRRMKNGADELRPLWILHRIETPSAHCLFADSESNSVSSGMQWRWRFLGVVCQMRQWDSGRMWQDEERCWKSFVRWRILAGGCREMAKPPEFWVCWTASFGMVQVMQNMTSTELEESGCRYRDPDDWWIQRYHRMIESCMETIVGYRRCGGSRWRMCNRSWGFVSQAVSD